MIKPQSLDIPFRAITVSGSLAVGTSTLAKNLHQNLGWKYVNAGEVQRAYDIQHNLETNRNSALSRTDEHEREIEAMTKKMLEEEQNIVYEAWLAGFIAKEMPDVFRILVICSNDDVRVDRIANRDDMTIEDAKMYLRKREEGNIQKWKSLYGDHDFWDHSLYNLVIDTYRKGPMETLGLVLDAMAHKK